MVVGARACMFVWVQNVRWGGAADVWSSEDSRLQHSLASLYIDIAWLVCIYMIIINISRVTRFWSFCFCCLTFYISVFNLNSVLYCSMLVSNVLDVTNIHAYHGGLST